MSTAIRHHYLSQFYLRGFQYEDRNWVYDRVTKKLRRDVPKNIAVISKLYTVENVERIVSTEIESTFAQIENVAVSIIKKIEQRGVITYSEKQELSLFIALLSTRVPQFFDNISDILEAQLKSYSQIAFADQGRVDHLIRQYPEELKDLDSEGLVEFVQRDEFEINPTREFLLVKMLMLGLEIAHSLYQMEWFILHSVDNQPIVTNDAPFIILAPKNLEPPYPYGIGITHKDAVKIVPLTKNCALAMVNPGNRLVHRGFNKEQVTKLNEIMALSSERLLIGSSKELLNSIIDSTNLSNIQAKESVSSNRFGNSAQGFITVTALNVDAFSSEFLGDLID